MTIFKRFEGSAPDLIEQLVVDGSIDTRRGVDYRISEGLEHAVNTALGLCRPIVVSGETGCGKTELGFAIARKLGIERVHFYSVKSDSEAQRLFYDYDSLQRFHVAQSAPRRAVNAKHTKTAIVLDDTHPLNFMRYHALGLAILEAIPADEVKDLLPPDYTFLAKPVRSVVVIDEIDKAPRDFPNDLLNEIDQLWFRVPELANWVEVPETPRTPMPPELRPIIVITSNLERQLPDALLRRCVFHHIEYPDIETEEGRTLLENIVLGHLRHDALKVADEDLGKAIAFITNARELALDKKPGVAELWSSCASWSFVSTNSKTKHFARKLLHAYLH